MCRRSEPAQVDADLADDAMSAKVLEARDRHYLPDGGAKGRKVRLDLHVDAGGRCIKSVDLIEMKAQQKAMVLGHAAAQGFAKFLVRGLHPAIGKARQFDGIGLAGNQRLDDGPAALAHDIGKHGVHFDVGVFECLLHPQHVPRLRVRIRLRMSWVGVSGTKLARIRPCANNSASHIASLTSVLRPGTFFTCAAFANTNTNSPSSKMCHTGFQ
jgi:hypothetical protein